MTHALFPQQALYRRFTYIHTQIKAILSTECWYRVCMYARGGTSAALHVQ